MQQTLDELFVKIKCIMQFLFGRVTVCIYDISPSRQLSCDKHIGRKKSLKICPIHQVRLNSEQICEMDRSSEYRECYIHVSISQTLGTLSIYTRLEYQCNPCRYHHLFVNTQ